MILYAAVNGYIDDVPLDRIAAFETDFHQFIAINHPEIGEFIAREKEISPQTEERLKAAIAEFKKGYSSESD